MDQGKEQKSGCEGVSVGRGGPVSPPPHIMLIGTQTHSDAAAERGIRGSEATMVWGGTNLASLSPMQAAVSHLEENNHK